MAQLQKGTTYITGDQVTAANLNALVDSGILTPGAVTDQTAKTVPLAADTILLHSAADTALRKTTMTQLFATPQPLGATTPSSVAATTGTFSSTLGVTGVATLGNGAILGTPASGTVTNLTGTASININGTVGATTPSTIAATTISGTGATINTTTGQSLLTLSDGGVGSYSRLNMRGGGTNLAWSFGAQDITTNALTITPSTTNGGTTFTTPIATFTSTGLNSTAIGATTAAAGSFTTIGATGDITSSSTGIIYANSTNNIPLRLESQTTGYCALRITNTGGTSFFGAEGSAGGTLVVGSTAYDTFVRGPSGIAFSANAGSNMQMRISSTGAAITGTLSVASSTSGASRKILNEIYGAAASNNATVDVWVGTEASPVGGNFLVGNFYVYVTGVSGANAFSGVYTIVTTGNGTTDATLNAVSTVTRGTSPVSTVQIANDGVGGRVKLTVTYINNSGVVTGGTSYVSFVGQIY